MIANLQKGRGGKDAALSDENFFPDLNPGLVISVGGYPYLAESFEDCCLFYAYKTFAKRVAFKLKRWVYAGYRFLLAQPSPTSESCTKVASGLEEVHFGDVYRFRVSVSER